MFHLYSSQVVWAVMITYLSHHHHHRQVSMEGRWTWTRLKEGTWEDSSHKIEVCSSYSAVYRDGVMVRRYASKVKVH